jgi:hypothetical protein
VKEQCSIPVSVPWCSTGHFRDLRIWLLDNIPNHEDYHLNGVDLDFPRNRVVYFHKEKDAMMFALRWA